MPFVVRQYASTLDQSRVKDFIYKDCVYQAVQIYITTIQMSLIEAAEPDQNSTILKVARAGRGRRTSWS